MTNQIKILFTNFDEPLSDVLYGKYFDLLPIDQKEKNERFIRWQDRHSHLFGRLLLRTGLELYVQEPNCLDDLQYNKYNRPFINEEIDFNISHSGIYVICAFGKGLNLGVDIEKVQILELEDFNKVMTQDQWQDINKDMNPMWTFFKYWTIKESVIKADSRGLSIPLEDIHVKNNQVSYDNSTWYLHQLDFDQEYCACLATNVQNVDVSFKYIDFYSENGEWNKDNDPTYAKALVEEEIKATENWRQIVCARSMTTNNRI